MTTSTTQIYVAHQDAGHLVVVAPPYSSLAGLFLGAGLAFWIAGVVVSSALKARTGGAAKPFLWAVFPLLLALVIGAPLVCVGFLTSRTTRVSVTTDQSQLKVQQSLLSVPFGTRVYALDNVQKAVVGIGNSCISLRAVMTDGSSQQLIGCTDRTGYNEVADSINRFLEAHRPPSQL